MGKFIADLHVHSGYSRATSRAMCPEGLWLWAQLKGITVIGTGDFTHPAYFRELSDKLVPDGSGLYRLRDEHVSAAPGLEPMPGNVPASCASDVRFVLQAEISSIYKKNGRTRKVHSIVLMPGLDDVAELNRRLEKIGNIRSDGRPILGLDARELLAIVLDVSREGAVVPAHAWTPHFSVFGAMSGFDSLEECYEDLAPEIFAIETGLSSDPAMNRRLSALDGITLISNSDAHSPQKLGREANVLDVEMSYAGLMRAMRTGEGFSGTIEFFPEEGKYHVDGHRKCGVSMEPSETKRLGYKCPVCGRKLTVGVMHRVDDLADREEPAPSSFRSIIPLQEIIAEVMGRGVNTKGVREAYFDALRKLGSEFRVLLDASEADIAEAGSPELATAVMRMRAGDIHIEPGYDGEFGHISLTEKKRVAAVKPEHVRKDGRLF